MVNFSKRWNVFERHPLTLMVFSMVLTPLDHHHLMFFRVEPLVSLFSMVKGNDQRWFGFTIAQKVRTNKHLLGLLFNWTFESIFVSSITESLFLYGISPIGYSLFLRNLNCMLFLQLQLLIYLLPNIFDSPTLSTSINYLL